MTQGALVGSVRRWIFEDLYEQCSFHIAEKMPSSVKVGSRPIRSRMRWYSSGFRPCAATSSGVMRVLRVHAIHVACATADFTLHGWVQGSHPTVLAAQKAVGMPRTAFLSGTAADRPIQNPVPPGPPPREAPADVPNRPRPARTAPRRKAGQLDVAARGPLPLMLPMRIAAESENVSRMEAVTTSSNPSRSKVSP